MHAKWLLKLSRHIDRQIGQIKQSYLINKTKIEPLLKEYWRICEQQRLSDPQITFDQLKSWLKVPLWTAAILTSASSFVDNPVLGSQVFNQAGLHAWRVSLAANLAVKRRARLAKKSKYITAHTGELSDTFSNAFSGGAINNFIADTEFFKQNGFIIKENFLSDAEFALLEQELLNTELPARETLQGNTVTRRIPLDYKTLPKLAQARQLIAQAYFQQLLNYVGSFKVQPMLYIQTILSQVRQANEDPQTSLHADTFHSSVKAWLFLTDVVEDEGPFVYVPSSHRLTPARLDWEKQRSIDIADADRMSARGSFRVSEQDLEQMGLPAPKAFAVKKNTLVIADTFGFHARGKSVRPSTRIEVWAFARRNPFLPWLGFDPLALPFLSDKVIPIYWWALDELEKRHWRKNPWRAVGHLRAGDPARFISK